MKKQIISFLLVVAGFFLGATALSALAQTWSPPGTGYPAGTNCTPPNCNVPAPINVSSSDQAKVGGINIGTANINPNTKLDVENGTIKAGGGLIIETRASNPTSPETGRMWLITS